MPKLIIVGGSPATGKSTIAQRISEHTGIKRVSMDEIKETLFDVGGYRDRKWSIQIGRLAWPVFQRLVEMHLDQGEDVIAEATFLWPSDMVWFHELKKNHCADLVQIWMTADPLVVRERFIARANNERHPGHCDALEHVMKEFDSRFFNRTFIPHPLRERTFVVDTTDFDSLDHAQILDHLDL